MGIYLLSPLGRPIRENISIYPVRSLFDIGWEKRQCVNHMVDNIRSFGSVLNESTDSGV